VKNVDIDQARYWAQAANTGYYGNLILWFLSHGYWHIYFLVSFILSYAVSFFWSRQVEKMRKNG
jgi:hypothetical protein